MPTKKESFRTLYIAIKEKDHYYVEPGRGIREEYEYQYNNNNKKVLVKVREINSYLEIQSHADQCDIAKIIARAKAGDMSDFRKDGKYADMTNIPDNLIECQKKWNKVENFFMNQPIEVRKKYNFDINEFAADIGKESWLINTGLLNPKPTAERKATAPETTVPVPTPEPEAK